MSTVVHVRSYLKLGLRPRNWPDEFRQRLECGSRLEPGDRVWADTGLMISPHQPRVIRKLVETQSINQRWSDCCE